jgi:hypothetical protein
LILQWFYVKFDLLNVKCVKNVILISKMKSDLFDF